MGVAAGFLMFGLLLLALGGLGAKSAASSSSTQTGGGTAGPGGGTVTPKGSDGQDILAAAAHWGVPAWILWGVYGMETGHGSNVSTSSAGAMGKMQFIPSTASSYNYPMTNSPNAQQSAQQFDSAAHLLHDLFSKVHSWDAAIKSYSGGGYGLSQVQSQAAGAP